MWPACFDRACEGSYEPDLADRLALIGSGRADEDPASTLDWDIDIENLPPRPSAPSDVWQPHLPVDVVNLIVDHLQTGMSPADARAEGARLSLVSRDWRDAGQRLVFRKVEQTSIGAYSPLARGTGQRFPRLSMFVQVVYLDPLVHQPSENNYHELLDACSQLQELRVHSVSSTVARCVACLPRTCGGQHLTSLSLVFAPSNEDVECLKLHFLHGLEHLETLALVLPLAYLRVLPNEFSKQQRLRLKNLRVSFTGDDVDALDAACTSIFSLVDGQALISLLFFAATMSPALLAWLRRAKSLVRLHLSVTARLVGLLDSFIATSRALSATRHLKLQQLRPAAVPSASRLVQEPLHTIFLSNLPPVLETCTVDVHIAQRAQHSAGSAWPSFLAARGKIGLKRFSFGRVDGNGMHQWTRMDDGEKAHWVRPPFKPESGAFGPT
ncbi:hypothetical protein JCM3770_001189 [Rhodotorula araucariae]